MQEFYEKFVGLELLERYENTMVFFQIGLDHAQSLALCDQSDEVDHRSRHYDGFDPDKSTLHHIVFTISLSDYDAEKERIQNLGLGVERSAHAWVHYRSLYITDPEGMSSSLFAMLPACDSGKLPFDSAMN